MKGLLLVLTIQTVIDKCNKIVQLWFVWLERESRIGIPHSEILYRAEPVDYSRF